MKSIKTLAIAMVAALAFCAAPLTADIILEDWQFNDANGTQLNAVANDGTANTSWNFGGAKTQNGLLNIGDTASFKWNVTNTASNTFRNATFANSLTSGQYLFEYRVQNWNLGGTDGVGETNNGIRFNIGNNTDYAQVRFEVSQNTSDIRGRIVDTGSTIDGTHTQFQCGSNSVVQRNNFITFQVFADLDTGDWSARTRAGSTNAWTDLTTGGTGMNEISRLQLVVQSGNPNAWEYGGVQGTSTEFIQLDYATLTQFSAVPEPSSFMLFGMATIGLVARRRRK